MKFQVFSFQIYPLYADQHFSSPEKLEQYANIFYVWGYELLKDSYVKHPLLSFT